MTLLNKRNLVILLGVIILVCTAVFFYQRTNRKGGSYERELQTQYMQAIQQYSLASSQYEVEANAIESYLYIATLQAFQLAQMAGVESREYRDYEQKYAEYRTFRDTRVKRMLERSQR